VLSQNIAGRKSFPFPISVLYIDTSFALKFSFTDFQKILFAIAACVFDSYTSIAAGKNFQTHF
jgi:hypothetical protein